MKITPEEVVAYVSRTTYRPLRPRDLARKLEITEKDYRKFRRMIRDMISSGDLIRVRGGRIGLPDQMNLKVGKIQITTKGFGFLQPEDESEEIYIRANDTKTSLNGDKVVVRLKPYQKGKSPEGEVVKVLERATNIIIGTYHKSRYFEYIEPDDPVFKRDVYLLPEHGLEVKDGQKVAVTLVEWKNEFLNPEGKLVEVLGYPDENGVDVLSIIKKFNLPTSFPDHVELAAQEIESGINPEEIKRRKDLRDDITFTIDPITAKDFDDAVSIETDSEGNYKLGVHIADVSHYVKEDTVLDREARNRGTSVYLVDRVLPMLPEKLSNEICSLCENEDRLTYTCQITINPEGKIKNYKIYKSIINSSARLNYEQVQEFFDNGKNDGLPDKVPQKLKQMRKLAGILRKQRFLQGSLDFDLPEPLVVMDNSGEVVDIRTRVRKESHKLVEEFMLLANKCVAKYFIRLGLPTLFRVHDYPDREKLESFRETARKFGYNLKITDPVKPRQLAEFLKKIEGKPEEELLNEVLLRSLKKAMYQRVNIGHFGLAFKDYLHFTSPIRRYPDLLVHRLLAEIKNKRYPSRRMAGIKPFLDKVGNHSSDMEVLAEKAERETIKVKQVLYLSRRIGDIFEGVISGITSGGFFVRLLRFSAEGMVRLSSMSDDYYFVDMEKYTITGRHTKQSYRMGDRVFVQIMAADLVFNRIDLRVVHGEKNNNKSRRKKNNKGK